MASAQEMNVPAAANRSYFRRMYFTDTFMADADTALVAKAFNIAEREQYPDAHHVPRIAARPKSNGRGGIPLLRTLARRGVAPERLL